MLRRRTVVLAGIVVSALLAGVSRPVWIDALAPDFTGAAQAIEVTGHEAAPAVLALAVVALAASLATSLSSTWVRFVTGPVLIAAGLAAAGASALVLSDPEQAARSTVAAVTGVSGGELLAELTIWPLLGLLPAAAVAAVGVAVLVAGGSWPVGTRYRSVAVPASDPADDPAAAWDALTRGEDPTDADEDLTDADEDPPDEGGDEGPRVAQ